MHAPDRNELNGGWTIPETYGVDRLVLLPRDPYWLYVYWEVTPALDGHFRALYGDAWDVGRTVLRLTDLETGAISDTELTFFTDNWYLNVAGADRTYRAELGRILPGGQFAAMVSSNTVRTPRDSVSSVIDPRWKMFAFWQQRHFRRISGLSSFEPFQQGHVPPGGENL